MSSQRSYQEKDAARKEAQLDAVDVFLPRLRGLGAEEPIEILAKGCSHEVRYGEEVLRFFEWEMKKGKCFVELYDYDFNRIYSDPRQLFFFPSWKPNASQTWKECPYAQEKTRGGQNTYIVPRSALQPVDLTDHFDSEEEERELTTRTPDVSVLTETPQTIVPTVGVFGLGNITTMEQLMVELSMPSEDQPYGEASELDRLAVNMRAPVSNKPWLNQRIMLAHLFHKLNNQ